MYTFVNLQKIIDTLPLYERQKLKIEGAEDVNVCLEDIYKVIPEYDLKDFLFNNGISIANDIAVSAYCSPDWDGIKRCFDDQIVTLDDFDTDDMVVYLEDLGYKVIEDY